MSKQILFVPAKKVRCKAKGKIIRSTVSWMCRVKEERLDFASTHD